MRTAKSCILVSLINIKKCVKLAVSTFIILSVIFRVDIEWRVFGVTLQFSMSVCFNFESCDCVWHDQDNMLS
jgi:hypothetical protein